MVLSGNLTDKRFSITTNKMSSFVDYTIDEKVWSLKDCTTQLVFKRFLKVFSAKD